MRLKCKVCGAILVIYADKPWELTWPQGKSPYGGNYAHRSTKDCPFHQGLSEEQLKAHRDVEVL